MAGTGAIRVMNGRSSVTNVIQATGVASVTLDFGPRMNG